MSAQTRLPRGGQLRPRGLRARLVWSTAGLTALAIAATVGSVMVIVAHLTTSRIDTELRGHLDTAAASLRLSSAGELTLAPLRGDDVDDNVWVFDATGRLVTGPLAGDDASSWVRQLARVPSETAAEHHDRRYLARPVEVRPGSGIKAVLVASESIGPYEANRDVALLALLALGVVVTIGTAGLTAWTVGRTLRPVHRMTTLASDWSEHDLDTRFALGDGADEFTELGNTLDRLLDRVSSALRDEQRLTSELAHELRTPLTAIRADAELGHLAAPTDERYPQIIASVDRLSATITALLAVAREQAGGNRRCDLHSVVVDLVAAMPATEVAIEVTLAPDTFHAAVSAEVAQRALAPVLENATRYAATRVTVAARAEHGTVVISVSDDGPGIAVADPESVFTPGHREESSAGAGLGLALARRVASAVGGRIAVVSTERPTTFEIQLPRR